MSLILSGINDHQYVVLMSPQQGPNLDRRFWANTQSAGMVIIDISADEKQSWDGWSRVDACYGKYDACDSLILCHESPPVIFHSLYTYCYHSDSLLGIKVYISWNEAKPHDGSITVLRWSYSFFLFNIFITFHFISRLYRKERLIRLLVWSSGFFPWLRWFFHPLLGDM